MNAPLPEAIRKALESASLDDKYRLESGRAFMSGVQALVRLPMLQRQPERSMRAGLPEITRERTVASLPAASSFFFGSGATSDSGVVSHTEPHHTPAAPSAIAAAT